MTDSGNTLAIDGGIPVRSTSMPKVKRYGEEEKRLLGELIDSDMLFYVFGDKVKAMQGKFRQMYGMKRRVGCSSGTAAVHIALGALAIPPGSEVITTSIYTCAFLHRHRKTTCKSEISQTLDRFPRRQNCCVQGWQHPPLASHPRNAPPTDYSTLRQR